MIGDDCLIRQGVSIGQERPTPGVPPREVPGPKLGNRVEVGAGAMLIGDITHRRRGAHRAERGGDDQRAGRRHRHRAPVADHGAAEAQAEAAEPAPEPAPEAAEPEADGAGEPAARRTGA